MTGWIVYDALVMGFGLTGGILARLRGWNGQPPVRLPWPRRSSSSARR